jgi:hypothetical protein
MIGIGRSLVYLVRRGLLNFVILLSDQFAGPFLFGVRHGEFGVLM